MLNLKEAAHLARVRIETRLLTADKQKKGLPRSVAIVQQGASFRVHLLEALRRSAGERQSPSPAPEPLFLAFPEKLFAKWYYLAYGPQRQAPDNPPDEAPLKVEWRLWDALGTQSRIMNFARTEPRAVLLAHGLSAIEDSVLLLADIGRAHRAARALRTPLRVLLADISWISYNRSLRRFDLDDSTIENGLRLCQDRRQRLYEGIGIEAKTHAIVPYHKKGAISSQKIQMIAARYMELAATLWGEDKLATATPLSNTDVAAIGKQLQASVDPKSPLHFLSGFPGALTALEKALSPHLNVVRTVAQRFRMLSNDTFSYYFAQYYAQDEYRGTHVKIAPVSERDFDEPYDELDHSFRSWGEGHEPEVQPPAKGQNKRKRLAAVYLPQYALGDWELLPYSPLSLSAVSKAAGSVQAVRDRVILTSDRDIEQQPKVETILRNTVSRAGCHAANRLVMDVVSFVQAVVLATGRGSVDAVFRQIAGGLEETLGRIDSNLPACFLVECEESAAIADLWLSWLDAVERETALNYTPSHLLLASKTIEDWDDATYAAASDFLLCANRLASELAE